MRPTTSSSRSLTMGLAIAMALLSPLAASAQSDLDSSQASSFMGEWVIDIESDFGPFSMNLELVDQGGKVAVSVGSPDLGGMQSVTDVSRDGESLVLVWEMDAQGQFVEATMTLEPEGEDVYAILEIADGQFIAEGVATKAGG
jgi:hypothetical protein